jgi:hypothetical protein
MCLPVVFSVIAPGQHDKYIVEKVMKIVYYCFTLPQNIMIIIA